MQPPASNGYRYRLDRPGLSERLSRAFREFLAIPTLIIFGFLLLAVGTNFLDRSPVAWVQPVRQTLSSVVFTDSRATGDFLGTVAGGVMTVTSITISMLLIALQQSAGYLSDQVFDQFFHRRQNQAYFGFFIGTALYVLVTLATVVETFNPVFGAALAFLLASFSLYLLIWLLYTTINQMRPEVIIEAVHENTLAAREHQLALIHRTRRSSLLDGAVCAPVQAVKHGFVTGIDLDSIAAAAGEGGGEVEAVLLVSMGTYVAFKDVVAEIKAHTLEDAQRVGKALLSAIHLDRQREIECDPAYGIEQLEMIAWTSISTSKSNPEPGLLTIRSLRDLLSRWVEEENGGNRQPAPADNAVPVVYTDNLFARVMDTVESLAVVSSESMQHQNFTEVVRSIAVLYGRLPPDLQRRAEDLILRILSALGDHVLTGELDATLSVLIQTLEKSHRIDVARSVQAAQESLRQSISRLSSRSTRVPKESS